MKATQKRSSHAKEQPAHGPEPLASSLEHPGYVARMERLWSISGAPKSMIVIEYCGQGDPYFGGGADDRPLGENGRVLTPEDRSSKHQCKPVVFTSIDKAHNAAQWITNRRVGSILGVAPTWR